MAARNGGVLVSSGGGSSSEAMPICGQCGTAFHKAGARFCSRCGARRDAPSHAAPTARAAATARLPEKSNTTAKDTTAGAMPALASVTPEMPPILSTAGAAAKGTLRPGDVAHLQEQKRKSGAGAAAAGGGSDGVGNGGSNGRSAPRPQPPALTDAASPSALEFRDPREATSITTPKRRSSGIATASGTTILPAAPPGATAATAAPREVPAKQAADDAPPRRRERRASSIYAKDGSLPELPPASMADPNRFQQAPPLLSSPSEVAGDGGGGGGGASALNHIPVPPREHRPAATSPHTTVLSRLEETRVAATVDAADFADTRAAARTSADRDLHASSDGTEDDETITSLRPTEAEEAQYTAWATLSPDGLTPEMLQTSNASELRQWHKGSLIGRGTYGSVYLGLLPDGSFHAVKCVELGNRKAADHLGALELVSLSREINMMHRLRHRNLCTFKGVYFDAEGAAICMFMEYIGGGSLSTIVKKFKPLPPTVVRSWTHQLLSGLHYLHSQHIIHRDIKGDNVLVDTTADPSAKAQIKLVDFGAARRLTDAVSQSSTVIGTPYWMAPEVVDASGDGNGYSYKADVWSVGCTVAEMLTGRPPWPSKTSAPAAIMMIASATGMPTEIPEEEATPGCLDFMKQCFIRNPEKRPTVQQLLHHPWITGKTA